ncbi:hypothetical protein GQ44DRAFT_627509 [Phaeosphaeriaceae sp. PMI808]|nr:hypothetical protein GQ44DRAFT_627509 [Phaeosphaeriaceae sp. PMI808]
MQTRHPSPSEGFRNPRPNTQRLRSNSFPIVEILGCSTPEAQLILAEGRAAVRRRRPCQRYSRSVDEDILVTYRPKNHLKYLERPVKASSTSEERIPSDARNCHARIPSDITDRSTSTIVPERRDGHVGTLASPTSPLGNYSANLAQFIKAQLKSIPTYQPRHDSATPLSPQSCPDFSFPAQISPLSPDKPMRRPADAPKTIEIPHVRPPMRSAFSAWSSTDDDSEIEDDAAFLPDMEGYAKDYAKDYISKSSNYAPSVLGYYETSNNNSSFLFSSTPIEDEKEPDTAKASSFPNQSALPGSMTEPPKDDDYPSSHLSQPLLTTSSASAHSHPHSSSSLSASSYFECKRPLAITSQLKDRVVAALTPPHTYGKTIPAISPWEGGAIANVHDVFVESQQCIRVDGMSFDMLRDFTVPSRVTTPC